MGDITDVLVTGAPGLVAVIVGYAYEDETFYGVVATDESGELRLRIRDGDPIPGRPGWTYREPGPIAIAADGRLVIEATLHDPMGDPLPGYGYAIVAPDGTVTPLIAPGDAIEVAPGEERTVSWIEPLVLDPELRFAAAQVGLENGGEATVTALYVTELVPEPQGAAWPTALVLAHLARRRSRQSAHPGQRVLRPHTGGSGRP